MILRLVLIVYEYYTSFSIVIVLIYIHINTKKHRIRTYIQQWSFVRICGKSEKHRFFHQNRSNFWYYIDIVIRLRVLHVIFVSDVWNHHVSLALLFWISYNCQFYVMQVDVQTGSYTYASSLVRAICGLHKTLSNDSKNIF